MYRSLFPRDMFAEMDRLQREMQQAFDLSPTIRGFGRNGLLEMRYVPGLETVNQGDYVVTTGQDGIYPPGLNVGTVVEVTPGTVTTPHTIRVKPGARLDSLQEVLVLLYRPPQQPAPERSLPNMDKGKKP